MKRLIIISFMLMLFTSGARAQYDPQFAHYFNMQTAFNPASAGRDAKMSINAAYNMSMAGFEHNPNTMFIAADMPVYFMKRYHGVGAQIMSDQIGVFRHQRIEAQYAAKIDLFGGVFSIGAQAGLLTENMDGSKLDLEDSNDPAFSSSSVDGNSVDLNAGIYYQHGPLYAGLSALHLTAPTVALGENNEFKINRTYYFTAGYNIKLRNPLLSISPSVLFKTDMTSYRGDVTARLVYTNDQKKMYMGLGYSPTNSLSVFIGGNVHGVILGYSYEYYTSGLSFINGSHELFVGYQMDINLHKKGRNKHQSVRIL